jgi:cation-transporting P-type ATPase 13A2
VHNLFRYVPLVPDPKEDNSQCAEVTTLFLVANFQYIFSVFAYSVGRPYRKAFFTNPSYVITLAVLIGLNVVLLLMTGGNSFTAWIINYFGMVDLPRNFRFMLLGLVLANSLLVVVCEEIHHYLLTTKDVCREQTKAGKSAVRK